MKKSFRVFNGKTWGGWGIVCAVIVLVMLGVRFDVLGLVNRVPDPARVRTVTVQANGGRAVLTTEEGIAQAEDLHRAIVADRAWNEREVYGALQEGGDRYVLDVFFSYAMKDGSSMQRHYALFYLSDDPDAGGEAGLVQELMNCPDAVRNRKQLGEVRLENMEGATIYATVTLDEAVALDGCDSVEEWLMDRGWYTRDEWRQLSEDERQTTLTEILLTQGKYEYSDYESVGFYDDNGMLRPFDSLDLDGVKVQTWHSLSAGEAWRFYEDALRPDLDEGLLGRVYILNDTAFENETYDAGIELDLVFSERPPEDFDDYYAGKDYEGKYHINFNTTPTVAAQRTADWLRDHGVTLRTPAELKGQYDK